MHIYHLSELFTLSNAKHGGKYWNRSRGNATSKGPQAKTTEHMDSIKVTYCSIQLGRIVARNGFAKNYMGFRPGPKVRFFHLVRADGWMDVIVFFVHDFFHTVKPIEIKLKTYHLFNKMKR